MSDLLVIVPSRGRPESVARVVEAWKATGAFDDGAELLFAVDVDDPTFDGYMGILQEYAGRPIRVHSSPTWKPMVHKLDSVAQLHVTYFEHRAIGFAGDDHLPRTPGWARRYLDELRAMGTGIVFGDDGIQGERLPTQWAMTSDIVRALGRMVPAPVEHLYCDNAIKDLGQAAGCLRYLPDVLIEHMHPIAGKAPVDAGYQRVNRPEQYRRDRIMYQSWSAGCLADDAAAVRALREVAARG